MGLTLADLIIEKDEIGCYIDIFLELSLIEFLANLSFKFAMTFQSWFDR
jgi:hypothetical protein